MISVIFDMDGTLLDTQRIVIPAWDTAGTRQGFENVGAHIRYVCGMNETGWSKYLEENFHGLDLVQFKKDVRDYIDKNLKVRFKPGAEKLLDFLDAHGIKYAIASGSSVKSIEHHLNEIGERERFGVLAGGKEVENGKPSPDVFLLAAERLDARPEDCFVFEDSKNGVLAGVAAGMRTFGIADVAPFDDDVKKVMFRELKTLDQAIEILEQFI